MPYSSFLAFYPAVHLPENPVHAYELIVQDTEDIFGFGRYNPFWYPLFFHSPSVIPLSTINPVW